MLPRQFVSRNWFFGPPSERLRKVPSRQSPAILVPCLVCTVSGRKPLSRPCSLTVRITPRHGTEMTACLTASRGHKPSGYPRVHLDDLSVLGSWPIFGARHLASVVGTRRPSSYNDYWQETGEQCAVHADVCEEILLGLRLVRLVRRAHNPRDRRLRQCKPRSAFQGRVRSFRKAVTVLTAASSGPNWPLLFPPSVGQWGSFPVTPGRENGDQVA